MPRCVFLPALNLLCFSHRYGVSVEVVSYYYRRFNDSDMMPAFLMDSEHIRAEGILAVCPREQRKRQREGTGK